MGGRLLVSGASSGIGRATVEAATEAGWKVAAVARRKTLLHALADETGATPVVADVTDERKCETLIEQAVEALGGLDALVYAAGVVPLRDLDHADTTTWLDVLTTNVVGASLVTAAALLHLEPEGRVVYLSSDSVERPFPGLVPYAASKAALEALGRGWPIEHPDVRFTVVKVGPTLTGMADGWDPGDASRHFERWYAEGYIDQQAPAQEASVVAHAIVALLGDPDPPATVSVVDGQTS